MNNKIILKNKVDRFYILLRKKKNEKKLKQIRNLIIMKNNRIIDSDEDIIQFV